MKSSQQRTRSDSSDALDAGIAAAYGAAHASVLDVVARLPEENRCTSSCAGPAVDRKPSANGASESFRAAAPTTRSSARSRAAAWA
jgi:hypothetical protein